MYCMDSVLYGVKAPPSPPGREYNWLLLPRSLIHTLLDDSIPFQQNNYMVSVFTPYCATHLRSWTRSPLDHLFID